MIRVLTAMHVRYSPIILAESLYAVEKYNINFVYYILFGYKNI